MASTYTTNNGIEKPGIGEQDDTWGVTANLMYDLIDEALDGHATLTLTATGSTGAPNALPITDAALSSGRNRVVTIYSATDLGGTSYVQLQPNDAEKVMFIKNTLGGSRDVVVFQGTYSAPNALTITNGKSAIVSFNGGGSGAVVTNLMGDLLLTSPLSIASGGTGAASASAARTALGLVIGTDVQAYDADLATLAAHGTVGQIARSTGSAVAWASPIQLGTLTAASSTAVDFTGIPAAARLIFVTMNGVSLSGTDDILVQVGDSGGIETSGYSSGAAYIATGVSPATGSSASGFLIATGTATQGATGIMVLTMNEAAAFRWSMSHSFVIQTSPSTIITTGAGNKPLSAALDRVRITTTGSNTFDAGSINIGYI